MTGRQRLFYGGQAVIEGVMMRGRKVMVVAVRAPSSEIVVRVEPLPTRLYSGLWARIPFVRGVIMLWDAIGLGTKALMYSADVALADEGAGEREAGAAKPVLWATATLAVVLGVGLFFVLPMAVVGLVDRFIGSSLLSNLLEGLVRLGLLVAYIGGIGMFPDIRRVYQYHGAEHKCINAYEAAAPLEPEVVHGHSRTHIRCGTGFLLLVVAVSVVVFAALGRPDMPWRLASRIVLIPLIAALAYEGVRFSANHYGNAMVRAFMQPGLALQSLTTREPDLSQVEVAIAALTAVLGREFPAKIREGGQVEAESKPAVVGA